MIFEVGDKVRIKTQVELIKEKDVTVEAIDSPVFDWMFQVKHDNIDWDSEGIMCAFCGMDAKITEIDDDGTMKLTLEKTEQNEDIIAKNPEKNLYLNRIQEFWFSPVDLIFKKKPSSKEDKDKDEHFFKVSLQLNKDTVFRCIVARQSPVEAIIAANSTYDELNNTTTTLNDYEGITVKQVKKLDVIVL